MIAAAAAGVLYLISFFLADVPAVSLAILLAGRAVLGDAESFMISGVLNWGLALAGPGNRPAAVGHNKSGQLTRPDQLFADVALIINPTAAIAIAPSTAPVKASMMRTSTTLGSFTLPLPATTVSTIV